VLHTRQQFAAKLADGSTPAETLEMRPKEYFAGQAVPVILANEAVDIETIGN